MNKAFLFGRIGKDPDLRYTPAGTAVATASMATSERYTKDGQKQEKTTWHNLVIWGKLAEIFSKHVAKGDQLLVDGKIENRSYDDREGNKKYVSEIIVVGFEFVGSSNSEPKPKQQNSQQHSDHDEPPFDPDREVPF